MTKYGKHVSRKVTPQSEAIPGSTQAENSAGGFAWAVDDWTRLDRFLILGSEGGSYYASERKLTRENAAAVERCIQADGPRTVRRIVEISDAGRAPKNDPAILALALAAKLGDDATRKEAHAALPKVCRIGTHLFHFAAYVDEIGGWGRGTRRAVANWYLQKPVQYLAYQAVKYQQRDGWAHRDLLRLSHPKASGETEVLLRWILGKPVGLRSYATDEPPPGLPVETLPDICVAADGAKTMKSATQIRVLIEQHNLPREAVPTEFLNDPMVWEALLENMPMTAMIRNLATMTRVGLLKPLSAACQKVIGEIGSVDRIRKARVHPIALLAALKTYAAGHGAKGKHTWSPVQQVVDALDAAFYESFGNVEPSGARTMLALDVSGSMDGGEVAGIPGLTPRVASSAMAMVTAKTEKQWACVGFTSEGGMRSFLGRGSTAITQLPISPKMRLDDICRATHGLPFGGTDCALPMLAALANGLEVDHFVIYTDSETWAGNIHPSQALARYRRETGIKAKLTVVGMVSNGFTIADPNDPGMLDVVGFDTAAPQIISDFGRPAAS